MRGRSRLRGRRGLCRRGWRRSTRRGWSRRWLVRDGRQFCDDFFRRSFADGASRIPDAALRQSIFAAAGARLGVETVQSDFLLLGCEFREVDARKFGGSVGMFEKNFAGVLERFHFCLDGKTEQGVNFSFVERRIQKSDVLLNDAAFGVQDEGSGQGRDAAVCHADGVGSHGDGIVDASFRDVLLNLGGVIVVDIEADDLEAVFILILQNDEIGDFGAARSTPGGPEIQKDNFAVEGSEGERLAIEGGELEAGRGIGIADKADDRFVVLLRGSEYRPKEKK